MKKIVSMKKNSKEERLEALARDLEDIKMRFAELADEYEEEGAEAGTIDILGEALAALDDTIDGIHDAL